MSTLSSKTGICLSLFLLIGFSMPEDAQARGFKIHWAPALDISMKSAEYWLAAGISVFLLGSYIRLVTKEKKTAKTAAEIYEELNKTNNPTDALLCLLEGFDDVWIGTEGKIPYMYVSGSKFIIPEDREYLYTDITHTHEKIEMYATKGRKPHGILGCIQYWLINITSGLKVIREANELLGFVGIETPLTPQSAQKAQKD